MLDELVQVDGQQLEGDAQMVAKVKLVQHVDDVHAVARVLLAQVVQDLDFYKRLVVKALFIPYELHGAVLRQLVVIAL